ncbi:hypothetical protein PHMEG_00019151, partial [Phytophthora megakarya]
FREGRALIGRNESQNSTGAQHAHMLIWINNMFSTVVEYYKLFEPDKFRQAMVEYVDRIAASNVPLKFKPTCFPKEPCQTTHWCTNNWIHLKRLPGNEYVSTFIPELSNIFKCNHDIKFLGAGDGPEKASYMMKYTTKSQEDIEKPWVIHLHTYDKSRQREEEDPSDPVAIGRRRVQSMCCKLSNAYEISAPMACLYLERESAVYSSHSFV